MNKILILANLVTLIVLSACGPNHQPVFEVAEHPNSSQLPAAYRQLIPDDYETPAVLPASIDDPTLQAAWVIVYNQTQPVTLHDGSTITGRELALSVIEREIPVRWDTELKCNGNSCTTRSVCQTLYCAKNYQPDKVQPIHISMRFQDRQVYTLARLAGSIAHELYHYTLPFGSVSTTLYEEYWAYYIGAQIENAGWGDFTSRDPLKSACLREWFDVHNLSGHLDKDPYPMTFDKPVDTSSETCTSISK